MRSSSGFFDMHIAARRQLVVRRQYTYEHDSKCAALISIWIILLRGHSVKMANVAGKFIVVEQVLS